MTKQTVGVSSVVKNLDFQYITILKHGRSQGLKVSEVWGVVKNWAIINTTRYIHKTL